MTRVCVFGSNHAEELVELCDVDKLLQSVYVHKWNEVDDKRAIILNRHIKCSRLASIFCYWKTDT